MDGDGGVFGGPPPRLSSSLFQQCVSQGDPKAWLHELAEQGRFVGELRPLRRMAWALFFGVITGNAPEKWAEELEGQRNYYAGLLEERAREVDTKLVDPKLANPLNRSEDNPFVKMQANDELLKEIWKDVERTFPENKFLAGHESRQIMQRVLFHWCRAANPAKSASDSYRQGMNELVGVVLLIVKHGEYVKGVGEEAGALGCRLCGEDVIEADTFTLFSRLMELGLKSMFTVHERPKAKAQARGLAGAGGGRGLQGPNSAILARGSFVYDTVLKAADPALYDHLHRLEIEPQLFMLRWLRLMFCREFQLEDTLVLWDTIFADGEKHRGEPLKMKYPAGTDDMSRAVYKEACEASANLPLVDYVAVAMLRSMRGELLGNDQSGCLRRLMDQMRATAPRPTADAALKLRAGRPPPKPAPLGNPDHKAGSLFDEIPTASPQLGPLGGSSAAPKTGSHGNPLFPSVGSARSGYPEEKKGNPLSPGTQGLFDSGKQPSTVQKAGSSGLKSQAPSSLFDDTIPAAGGYSVAELQKKVAAAEAERDTIKKKANEFMAVRKAEWTAQISSLETRLEERDARIAELERKLDQASAVGSGSQGAAEEEKAAWRSKAEEYEGHIRTLEQQLAEAQAAAAASEAAAAAAAATAAATSEAAAAAAAATAAATSAPADAGEKEEPPAPAAPAEAPSEAPAPPVEAASTEAAPASAGADGDSGAAGAGEAASA